MAVTDEMNDLSSSHHRRLEAENAAKQSMSRPVASIKSGKSQENSQTSVETHSEEEEYLANDPYLAELLNSNHSRTTFYAGSYLPKASSTMSSLSAHEATRTWNDLSSVHSKADTALDAHHDSSSSSFMDSASSMASFGNSEDEHSNRGGNDNSESFHDDDDEDLSLQKQAFQKLFDSPRKDAKEIAAASLKALPPLVSGPGGRRMYRSSSVKVRPTYHGPKLGLIEENSMH